MKAMEQQQNEKSAIIQKETRLITKREKEAKKLEILEACGENVSSVGAQEIIVKKYDAVNAACKPTRMNLDAVQGKDKYDDPMRILLGG